MAATSCQQGAYTRDGYIGLKGQTRLASVRPVKDPGLGPKGRNRRHTVDYQAMAPLANNSSMFKATLMSCRPEQLKS